jgi:hypothetical protein
MLTLEVIQEKRGWEFKVLALECWSNGILES